MTAFDPVQYKVNTKANWNAVAHTYHEGWANSHVGPFRSTKELIKLAQIKPSDKILDVGCGTGVVSREASLQLRDDGLLVGIDLSRTALLIAKKSITYRNLALIEMDAETLGLNFQFDKILSQYVLMFCPDINRALYNIRKNLRPGGTFVLAVHGLKEDVPYFSTIMESILKYIPDIRPEGTPTVHRFGDVSVLQKTLESTGFDKIEIKKYNFEYRPGTFEEYWHDYMNSTANSIRPKLESAGKETISKIKDQSLQNALPYINDGGITFPWTVIIAKAG